MTKSKVLFLIFLFCMESFLFLGCDFKVPFHGPVNRLYIENEKWEKLSIKYWVVIDTSDSLNWVENEKKFEIITPDIENLKNKFVTLSSQGSALGNPCSWILKTDKNEWYMELRSPDHAFFCSTVDTEMAYSVNLKTTDVHEFIRNICYLHEKKSTPDIRIESIRVCERFGGNEPPQENIVPANSYCDCYNTSTVVPPTQNEDANGQTVQ